MFLKRRFQWRLRTVSGWISSSVCDRCRPSSVRHKNNGGSEARVSGSIICRGSPRRGMRGKGSMKRPARRQIRQRSHKTRCAQAGTAEAEGRLPHRPVHNQMMREVIERNPDPSRGVAAAGIAAGNRAAVADDRVALPGSAGVAGWRAAVVRHGPARCIRRCSTVCPRSQCEQMKKTARQCPPRHTR